MVLDSLVAEAEAMRPANWETATCEIPEVWATVRLPRQVSPTADTVDLLPTQAVRRGWNPEIIQVAYGALCGALFGATAVVALAVAAVASGAL